MLALPDATIRNQGRTNTCASAAVVAGMEHVAASSGRKLVLSHRYSYYATSLQPESNDELGIRAVLFAAVRRGVCRSRLYDGSGGATSKTRLEELRARPREAAHSDAFKHRIAWNVPETNAPGYAQLTCTRSAWKAALRRGHAVLVGHCITSSYVALVDKRADSLDHALVDRFDAAEASTSPKHAGLVRAFSEGRFLVQDSRGEGFGHRGFYALAEDLVSSKWVVQSWLISDLSLL